MRVDFVKAMSAVFASDEKAVFITGDLGYNALEGLRDAHPQRFINAGVAEQNMVGMAAGMALLGYRPWVYSIAPFAVFRCFEQIRNDVCLHNLTVRVVGNGGGYTYGVMGSTHHAMEDLGVLKTLPNMQLYFPCSNNQVSTVVQHVQNSAGPSYLRLAISGFAQNQDPLEEDLETLTRHYAQGSELTMVAVGHAAQIALSTLPLLPRQGMVDLFGVAHFPLELSHNQALVRSVQRTGRLLLVDEHYQAGSVAESLRAQLPPVQHFRLACAHYRHDQRYGSSRFHLEQAGLAPQDVYQHIRFLLGASA